MFMFIDGYIRLGTTTPRR